MQTSPRGRDVKTLLYRCLVPHNGSAGHLCFVHMQDICLHFTKAVENLFQDCI